MIGLKRTRRRPRVRTASMRPAARQLSTPLLAFALLGLVMLGGCRWWRGQPAVSETGAAGHAGVVVPAVTFGEISPILQTACAQPCHNGGGGAADDFDFRDDGNLLMRLLAPAPTTVPLPCQNRPLVVPGDAGKSLLVAMIEAPDEPRGECAERMPHSCPDRRACLTSAEIQTIRLWIQAGAPR